MRREKAGPESGFREILDMVEVAKGRICTVVHLQGKTPRACGGTIQNVQVPQPFTMHTPIGGPPGKPVMRYARCTRCGILYEAH